MPTAKRHSRGHTDSNITHLDAEVLDSDTLALMLERRRVENEHTREEIAALLQEADDKRTALVRGNRTDSARAFLQTDVAIRIDDLEFKVAASERRAMGVQAEVDHVERRIATQSRQAADASVQSKALQERLETLQQANDQLRDKCLAHQLSLNNVTSKSGQAAHRVHIRLKEIIHQLQLCDQAINRAKHEHHSIAREAERDAEAHRVHATEQLRRIHRSDDEASNIRRQLEDALRDGVQIERASTDIHAFEQQLRQQLEAKDLHVAELHRNEQRAKQAVAALKNQADALQRAKRHLEKDVDETTHRLSIVEGKLGVVTDALGDLRVRSASARIASPRASLLRLSDLAAHEYEQRIMDALEANGYNEIASQQRGDSSGENQLADLGQERQQLSEALENTRTRLHENVLDLQRRLRDLENRNLELGHARRDKLAELELVQRRLDALDSSNLQLQEVADSLGARRDELNDAITRIETEGREFARAAQEEIDGDGTGSNNPGLVEELKELVQRREQCERIIASLDHHRQSSVLAAKIIASHPDSGTLAAIAAATGEDSGGNGQLESKRSSLIASVGGDRGVIVVAGGQKELLLQEADDHRRWYAQEQHRRGLQLNEISYSMDLCTAKDREAQRQLAELEKTAAALQRANDAAQAELTAITSDAMAERARLSEKLLLTAGAAEGSNESWERLQHETLRTKAASQRLADLAIPQAQRELSEAKLLQKKLIAQLEGQVEVEMLAEDTRDALEDKLAHHEEVLESYLAQIHQLSFEGDELAGRQLKFQAAVARGDVELQLVVDELQRMRSQRLDLQEQLRHEAGESTITRARIFDEVFSLNQNLMLFHHRLKRLTIAVQVSLQAEEALIATGDEREGQIGELRQQWTARLHEEQKRNHELDVELVQRHGTLHALTHQGAAFAEEVKDVALEAEEARSAKMKADVTAAAMAKTLMTRRQDLLAAQADIEGKAQILQAKQNACTRLTKHIEVIDAVEKVMSKDRAVLQSSVDHLKQELKGRERIHKELLDTLCNVRYGIARASNPTPAREDVAESLASSRRAYRELLGLVNSVLKSETTRN